MLVKDIMTTGIPKIKISTSLGELTEVLEKTRIDAVPVIGEDDKVIGVMTKYYLYRALLKGFNLDNTIENFVKKEFVSVYQNETFAHLRNKLLDLQVSQAIVINEENKVLGIVSKVDLIKTNYGESVTIASELKTIVNSYEEGVISLDINGNIKFVNQSTCKLLELDEESLFKKRIDEVLPEININNLLETKRTIIHSLKVDDKKLICKYSPIWKNNMIIGTIILLQDLTEYEQMTEELDSVKKLKQSLETVLEIAYDGIILIDENGTVTRINNKMCEFFGVLEKNILGTKVFHSLPKLHLEETLKQGVAEVGNIIEINGRNCLFTKFPLILDGEVKGAVGKLLYSDLDKLKDVIKRMDKVEKELNYYKSELTRVSKLDLKVNDIIGIDATMKKIKNEAARIAKGFSTVLLTGESGTGKEIFARAIHNESRRSSGPFIKVNCAAIPENLLESEFFGYEDGAFTGAKKGGKPGKFELADGGTLFLDEIGDMCMSLQAKLLRALQEREFERVGGTKTIKVNVRVIAATNKNLLELVDKGDFREDLYYRLNVINLQIPPLRERSGDIEQIVDFLINKFNHIMGCEVTGISPEALRILKGHKWPGNVRELENVIERALNMTFDAIIEVEHLPDYLNINENYYNDSKNVSSNFYQESLDSANLNIIMSALEKAEGNKTKAAKMLGISRSNLYEKLNKYSVNK